ncbi:MAG: UDP-2,4-diacetamido-2,4,6-trideoxy-beta-L-altropyranose hydrolase [Deltaproteobacteria bacterium]|nr:UDP-2,4-diacetamido-2,4,6-trideoxy-beta-L-altropyranose hydrolase [Deltaproteobacteria bacterium]
MKFVIRTDASRKIGSGHVMRCLTLAQELKEKGAEVCFICRLHPGNLNAFICKQGFVCLDLPSPEKHPQRISHPKNEYEAWLEVPQEVDAKETMDLLAEAGETLIVDHYGLDQNWEKRLAPHFQSIVVIDDLANRAHLCDLLLDQNLQPALHQKYPSLTPPTCKLLLGPSYALLREEFSAARKDLKIREGKISKLCIFFGGVDTSNESLKAIKACLKVSAPLELQVILGAANPHQKILSEFCTPYSQIKLYREVERVSQILKLSDLAIGAGGVSTWERAALGVPTLAWSISNNQEALLQSMAEEGRLIYLGKKEEITEETIREKIESLLAHPEQVQSLSKKSLELVDAKGAPRVATFLLNLHSEKKITLRPATFEDCQNIFEWRNHPETRQSSYNSKKISWKAHKVWFEKSLSNTHRKILIAEREAKSVGVLRYDYSGSGEEALTSIYLVPGNKGQGYGTQILIHAAAWLKKNHPKTKFLKAEIQEKNIVSQRAFAKAGYRLKNKIWVKPL